MGSTDNADSWGRIRMGIKDAEQLLGKKQYNLSMVKCRQTLEFMVRLLADKACLVDSDLSVSIDDLYQGKWISKTTCDHYHKIRMIGNKAVHEGNNSAYDANQAYHLLSLEARTFSNEYRTKKRRPAASASVPTKSRRTSRRGHSKSGFSLSQAVMLRILIAVLCVVFVIAIIRLFSPGKKDNPKETTPTVTTVETPPEATAPPETMAPTTPAAVYKTSSALNVRSQPSTSGSKLGQIPAGTVVEYVGPENDEWAIITYEGQKAYVASQYLIHD